MRQKQIRKQSVISVVVASLCLLGVPTVLSGTGEAESPNPSSLIAPCWWLVDPVPDETTDETTEETTEETTDETTEEATDETTVTTFDETTVTTIDRPLPYPCWYGPIHPYCWNWPQIYVDPPVTELPTTELPPVDEPSEPTYTIEPDEPPFRDDPVVTIEPDEPPFRDEPSEPTYTIEPQEPPFIEEPTDPTVTAVLPPWPSKIYCLRTLPVPGTPLGVSDDGAMSITGISPDVLPADESFEGGLITIYGTGFRAGSTVMIGEEECTSVEIVDEFSLTCDPPTGEISVRDVVVIDPDGVSVTAPASFEFMDPAGFWELPLYAFSSNPFERSTTVVEDSAADEDLAASGTSDEVAVPVFTG
jgi:hypothetical protein